MTMQENKNYKTKRGAVNVWLVAFVAILVASLLSWFMLNDLATSKTIFNSEINKITNSLEHINDADSSAVSFTSYQDNLINNLSDNTQSQFGSVNNAINDANTQISQTQTNLAVVNTQVNNLQTQANALQTQTGSLQAQTSTLATQSTQLNTQLTTASQTASSTQTALAKLTASVASLPSGLQITPSVSSGAITLSINSSVAQTVAFDIEFRPTTDMPQLATMDASLAALYTAPPVVLTAGAPVRGDYTLYWNTPDSLYHLGTINFLTMGTSLVSGLNTKTITYVSSGSYQILITPEYVTGTSTGSW